MRVGMITFLCAVFVLLMALSLINAGDSTSLHLHSILQAPSWAHPLGTDELGRSILHRLAEGVLLSIFVGIVVVIFSALIGISLGLLAGYVGGWLDSLIMRVTDIFLAFPGILLAIAFAALVGPSVENVIFALAIMGWMGFARQARAQTLALRKIEYVQAAQLSGVGMLKVLRYYILPNAAAPLIVEAVFAMAGAMLAESGLSFLGVGVQPPEPSLGAMLREGARYMLVAPHLVIAPGLALMGLVLLLNVMGDRLRDKLDVRTDK